MREIAVYHVLKGSWWMRSLQEHKSSTDTVTVKRTTCYKMGGQNIGVKSDRSEVCKDEVFGQEQVRSLATAILSREFQAKGIKRPR